MTWGRKFLLLSAVLVAIPLASWAKKPAIELHLEEIDRLGTKKALPAQEALEFPTLKLHQNSIIGNAVDSFITYQEERALREENPEIAARHSELAKNVKKIVPIIKEEEPNKQQKPQVIVEKPTEKEIVIPFDTTNFTLSQIGEKILQNSIIKLKNSEKRLSIKAHSLKTEDIEHNGKKLALMRAIEVRKLLINSGIDSLKVNVLVEEDENEQNYNKVFISFID